MALYEHIFIARQDISENQVAELTNMAETVVKAGKGKITKNEYWGLRTLAYRIQKNRKGHYTLLNIDAEHEVLSELERQLGLHDDVLRFMTLRVAEHEEGPSAPMRAKAREEEAALAGDASDNDEHASKKRFSRTPRSRPQNQDEITPNAETKTQTEVKNS